MHQEKTQPLLRPHQVENMREEQKRIEGMLQAPPHVSAAIQDRGELRRQLNSIVRSLESQSPKPYREEEVDAAIAREAELRESILNGMPTSAEMRRNPAGAVDKHRKWEERNKKAILEWKNVRLRMHETGILDELRDAKDVANFEKYRPTGASHELNMHGEQISGKVQYGPIPGAGPSTVISDEEKATLMEIDPEIASQIALMNNDQRAKVKEFLRGLGNQSYDDGMSQVSILKQKRDLTPEQRKEIGQRLAAGRARKKQQES